MWKQTIGRFNRVVLSCAHPCALCSFTDIWSRGEGVIQASFYIATHRFQHGWMGQGKGDGHFNAIGQPATNYNNWTYPTCHTLTQLITQKGDDKHPNKSVTDVIHQFKHLFTATCSSWHASNTLSFNEIYSQLIMLHIKELTLTCEMYMYMYIHIITTQVHSLFLHSHPSLHIKKTGKILLKGDWCFWWMCRWQWGWDGRIFVIMCNCCI